MANTFPKKEKLKSKKLIEKLFEEGKIITRYPIKLVYLKTLLPDDVRVQAGVAVPKKNFKRAVQRNRIKRLLREAYRLNKEIVLNNSDTNFAFLFLYLGKEMPEYADLDKRIKWILQTFLDTIDNEKNA